ncbi:glycoside hydrolase family 43 protein [Zasmidium cellare ATCC 36951]|uniref:Glycoside hydrolase family 43 protein n=1 Tax=Zasmidium cellare ATCC 36951 TaxID=1080233 RepID=A0A6A6C317_ZASCE|nr:glycoside hydrolase family 43 protein [Zasmidium cellare ATCC 36951]KAF2160678.1 glycoside hydrolase family 43 protein [Zasmidium cellare ATCC 36951]
MRSFWLSLSLLGSSIQQVLGAPVIDSKVQAVQRSLSKRAIAGPKINGANFADPAIINVNGVWYAFATRTIGSGIRIQVATSNDFNSWSLVYNEDGSQHDALPNLPSWVVQSAPNTWAPDVNILDDGSFVLYYSASTTQDASKHCVGAATSKNVLGPYTPTGDDTLFCDLSVGGAIDAAGFNDNGQRYVVYKVDGNSLGNGGACMNTVEPLKATPLILQPVAADGFTKTGSATTLLNHEGLSDDGVLEAPVLIKVSGTYFLFFSSGCFTTSNYDVSYATASSVTGPYTRVATSLLKTGNSGLQAPGGADVTKTGDKIVFHANNAGGRSLYTAGLTISGTTVAIS